MKQLIFFLYLHTLRACLEEEKTLTLHSQTIHTDMKTTIIMPLEDETLLFLGNKEKNYTFKEN